MAEIENKITQLCPQAQVDTTGEFPLVTVPDAQWHDLARALKTQLHYDVLSAVVGMDWKDAYGCVYYLTNTSTHELLHVKVTAPDRENPRLHSVVDLWPVANFQEREVYDFFGIVFIGHPDMRRMFLRTDWVGYPLRKDYDPASNPLRLEDAAAGSRTRTAMSRKSTARCLRTTSMSSTWARSTPQPTV